MLPWRSLKGLCLVALGLVSWVAWSAPEDKPTLEILGAHTTEGVKLPLATPTLDQVLRIQSTTTAAVESLKVVVTPLRDANGQLWFVQWDLGGKGQDTAVPVPAFGSVSLTLRAQLPAAGTYSGDLFLIHGDAPMRVPLSVVRGLRPLPVVVKNLLPVEGTTALWGDSEASVAATLELTSGPELTVVPRVVGMSQVRKDALQFQAPVEVKSPENIPLKEGAPTEARIVLKGLAGAGEYKGTLLFSSEGSQAVEQEVRVFLKEPWFLAFGWIGLGIGLSMFLRWVVQRVQPRLELQHGVLLLRRELEQAAQALDPLEPQERRVLLGVLNEADRMNARIAAGSLKAAEAGTRQLVLQAKCDLWAVWVGIRRQVREVRPYTLQETFAQLLSVAESRLLDSQAQAEELGKARGELMQVPQQIADAVRSELKTAIRELLAEVQVSHGSPDGSMLEREVTPHLETALRHVVANEPREAFEAYDRARRAYLPLLVRQLDSQLSEQAPLGFSENPWKALRKRVRAELATVEQAVNMDAAFAAYTRARRLFLEEGAHALLAEFPRHRKTIDEDPELNTKDREALKAELEKLEPLLQDVVRNAPGGKLTEATATFETVRERLQEVLTPAGDRSKPVMARPTLLTLAASAPTFAIGAPAGGIGPITGPLDLQSVTGWRWKIELAVSVFLALIAGLVGLMTLWANDLTWGGWTAHITAFFWGLGIHQATFSTLAGLAEGIVGKREPS
ncbi:hypothetical protein [Hyalangium minutum]|uniref:Uncharacterized protein n=1 Tax=Hyalangium minutum TaxID=394096 RepID=A0A085WFN4_9BACT|nr:hypothetical protein [Hyalangium minutum]KFE66497.1 hypothetical protein DB31_0970 [Hyalangium minutum]